MYEANDDLKLFQQAFIEAMKDNTRMVLAEYPEKPLYSKKHRRAMKQIMFGQRKPPIKTPGRIFQRKHMIAAFIAAVLILLSGLTIYANREAVVEFMKQIYETFTRVSFREDQEDEADFPDTIEEERIPAYVPDGFVMQDHQSVLLGVYVVWQKEEEYIIFNQSTIGNVYDLDNERSDFTIMTIGDFTVYTNQNEYSNTYIWNDEIYSYSLSCPTTLEVEDVGHIIQSVSKIK